MEIKNEYYPVYQKDPVNRIPSDHLESIIAELSANAMFFMSSTPGEIESKETLTATLYILKTHYGYLPLHLVTEAFSFGCLGRLGGTTRFTVRNIDTWLSAMMEKHQKLEMQRRGQEDNHRRSTDEKNFKTIQSNSILFGRALSLKLSWVYSCSIDPDDWDHYSLDAIVKHFRSGANEKTLRPSDIN